jgi:hypothetical protein
MKKFGLILALTLATGPPLAASSHAQSYPSWQDRDDAAPSIREFNHSANGG